MSNDRPFRNPDVSEEAPTTDGLLEAEIGTIEETLRRHRPTTPDLGDPECQRIVQLVEKIGCVPIPHCEDAANAEATTLSRISHYELLEMLGKGGMGSVYKARHVKLDKLVALKVLLPNSLKDVRAIARFEREMQAVGRLCHENIVAAHDAGEADGYHYLVMELVEGVTLSALVRRLGPLPIAEACEIIRRAAEGLQHAHSFNMVHRDIKPGNMMLTDAGQVKILDMGLARLGESTDANQRELTMAGQVMGTLDYMAPEQGTNSRQVDIRADIYSLGATLFKLLTNETPLDGSHHDSPVSKIMALAVETPRTLRELRSDVPPKLSQLVAQILARNPNQRPATPQELATLLSPFAQGANLEKLARAFRDQAAAVADASADTYLHLHGGCANTSVNTPLPQVVPAAPTKRPPRSLFAAAAAAGGLLFLAAVIIIIRNRDGQEVARLELQDGHSADIQLREAANAPSVPAPHLSPTTPHQATPSLPEATETAKTWRPNAEQQAFFDDVAQLPVEEQANAVILKLQEINPGFDGQATHVAVAKRGVTEFGVSTNEITELWPIRALRELTSLTCGGTAGSVGKLTNLSPLAGLPLQHLDCSSTAVTDLSPLMGAPLVDLHINGTQVSDLSPLKSTKLIQLACTSSQVTDLSPLTGLFLVSLDCSSTGVSDLSPLAGMPLNTLICSDTRVSELSAVAGLPIETLLCGGTRVWDLSPLTSMPLQRLDCYRSLVSDYRPVIGMPLSALKFSPLLFHAPEEKVVRESSATQWGEDHGDSRSTEAFWQELATRREALERFTTETAPLSAEEQLQVLREKLGEHAKLGRVIRDGAIQEVTLALEAYTDDVTSLRALTKLRKLTIHSDAFWLDLSPINALPLEELTCSLDIAQRNLPVLGDMVTLKIINGQPAATYLAGLANRTNP